jgi:hypothetical protein
LRWEITIFLTDVATRKDPEPPSELEIATAMAIRTRQGLTGAKLT